MKMRNTIVSMLVAAPLVAAPLVALTMSAQTEAFAQVEDSELSVIEGNAFSGALGVNAVNIASGRGISQLNGVALAYTNGGVAIATLVVRQGADHAGPDGPYSGEARIGGDAFAGAQGVMQANVSAGYDNLQANLVALAVGINGLAVAETVLSQSHATPPDDAEAPIEATYGEATVADSAFYGANGIVQVNESAGSRNAGANRFALLFSGGVNP